MKIPNAKILAGALLCAFLLLSVCCLVYAQDMTEAPEVSVPANAAAQEQQKIQGLHGMLGAGVFAGNRVVGERRMVVWPMPFVTLRYSDWAYWRSTQGGIWLLQSPDRTLKLGAGVGLRFGWEADNGRWASDHHDDVLEGMADRHTSLDGSINAVWWNPIAAVRVSYFHDILGVSDGSGARVSISHRFPIGQAFSISPFVGAEWQSRRLVNYYYGVRPDEATASRPEYHGRDSVNLQGGFFAGYRLTPTWSLFGSVSVKWLDDGIYDSPIVLDRYSAFSFIGVGWRF